MRLLVAALFLVRVALAPPNSWAYLTFTYPDSNSLSRTFILAPQNPAGEAVANFLASLS